MDERPILILKRPDGTPIGVLGNAKGVTFESNYNELSTLSFTLPAKVDGVDTPFYHDVSGLMIIELRGIGQFVVQNPEGGGNKVKRTKSVTANSLECEFGRKKISLPKSTYKFFDTMDPSNTILGMIMEEMPTWSVGSVAGTLLTKYRTFDVNNENLYNLIKGTVQQSYNCIFEFDTLNRVVNVRDADAEPAQKQVFVSRENLAKDIKVKEETDDIVTRLDVSGADGVNIREVNPTGTNRIINLDYYANNGYLPDGIVEKYNDWKQTIADSKLTFYNYAVRYAILVSEEIAENAKLTDLNGEYTSLENIQAVIIQGIASKIRTQADLDDINDQLTDKQAEIDAKQADIDRISDEKAELMVYMERIRSACAFENVFTEDERITLDPFLIDNEIQDSTFVASEVESYSDGEGNILQEAEIAISGAEITSVQSASESTVYSISGGRLVIDGLVASSVISGVIEERTNGKIILSLYAGNGIYKEAGSFPTACLSVSGTGSVSTDDTSATVTILDGTLYFSLNATDFEKKTVSWDLYEYGESVLAKMAQPSYSFSVDSANFIALEPFLLFKNELELGQRVYVEVEDSRVLQPICTGARIYFDDKPKLELLFTDTFTATDSKSKLVDILENSVSMGKTLESGKFTYGAWTDSGANTDLKNFINSTLDTARNAIMSSTDQAVSWDGAGLRLRKYEPGSKTAYTKEQIWMSNNSIMMTDDGWATAKMAIGKFTDDNVGEQWGIIAPMVVGTLLAGEELVIESEKKSGSQKGQRTIFRVDADGARLYNAEFEVQKTNDDGTTTQILLDPSVGLVMGYYPLLDENGDINFDPNDSQNSNAKFFADKDGNLYLAGSIYSYDGIIGGWTISQDGLYSGSTDATSVGMTSSGDIRIWAGKNSNDKANAPFYVKQDGTLKATKGQVGGWHIGTDYIGNADTKANSSVGMASETTDANVVFWAGNKTRASAPFRVQADGTMYATKGQVGGWYIGSDYIGNANTKAGSSVGMASGTGTSVVFWAGNSTRSSAPFRVQADGTLYATSGQVGGWYISSGHIGNASTKASSSVGMASGTGTDVVFWAGGAQASAPFRVQADGTVYSTSGKIGGWYIGGDYIGNGSTKANSSIGMAPGTGNAKVFWAGGAGSPSFYVEADGDLYAANGTFGGTVYATQVSTAYGALISGQIGESEIKTININATAVTNGKIAGGAVTNGKIGGGAVSHGKLDSTLQNAIDQAAALALWKASLSTGKHFFVDTVDFENKTYSGYTIGWIGTIDL